VEIFHDVPSVPVNSVVLLNSREEALNFPIGEIHLGFCDSCGFIYNTTFDQRLVEYSGRCEESQGFSSFFRKWHEGLAHRLIERHSLRRKSIIEIGCGKGEFLELLCNLGDNYGIGFDPAYVPGRTATDLSARVRFIPELFDEEYSGIHADFLCCKMTLEHISPVSDFIDVVRRSVTGGPDTTVFFQVPDILRILEEQAFWDIYYEHCSYFSTGSLARLFRRSGFDILQVSREYSNQYITIEARPANGRAASTQAEDDLEALTTLVRDFAQRVPMRISEWRKRLIEYRGRGVKTVIWGAGSKGVAFLATLDVPGAVKYAVDINANMWSHYTAKTGLKIIRPAQLQNYRPDVVIVMNPVYQAEIGSELVALGLSPQVLST
jgi:hypothetical protein